MKKLFEVADNYISGCSWKEIALIKLCVAAAGFIAGMFVPKEKRRLPIILSSILVVVTYIPLMRGFVGSVCRQVCPKPQESNGTEIEIETQQ